MRDDFPGVFITRTPSDPEYGAHGCSGRSPPSGALRRPSSSSSACSSTARARSTSSTDDLLKNERFRPCLLYNIDQCTAPCGNRITPRGVPRRHRPVRSFPHVQAQRDAPRAEAGDGGRGVRGPRVRDGPRCCATRSTPSRSSTSARNAPARPHGGLAAGGDDVRHRSRRRPAFAPEDARRWSEPIRGMEAIDIAHLQGGETVGSKVAFIDGRPFKDGYRRYRIRSVDNDDYMAIREVVSRRYREAGRRCNELYPDVDPDRRRSGPAPRRAGGVRPARRSSPPMVISLAKKEELIYVQQRTEPLRLGPRQPRAAAVPGDPGRGASVRAALSSCASEEER